MDVQLPQDGAPSHLDTQTDSSSLDQDQAPSLTELDKLERFKYQGQEWTPKDLEKAILRQKDYTQKTQQIAEERKQIESLKAEEKFYVNLAADLRLIEKNPNLASEFIKVYPQKFHSYLKQVLQDNRQAQPSQGQQPSYDVDVMSELQQMRSFIHKQEVEKNTVEINSLVDKYSKTYPDAIPELAIGRVFEAYNQLLAQDPNAKLTAKMWEDTFKTVDQEIKQMVKTKYGDLVKKQTAANSKARDVDSGGGTPGRAPKKFKNLGEVRDFAIQDLTGKGR